MSSRPSAVLALASILILSVQLAACVAPEPLPADPTGRLFGRGLDQIADLYIVPVSSRKLALAAARRLTSLDPKLEVVETPGPREKTEIALEYGGRDIATYPIPSADDPHLWGGWLGHLLADAKATSPTLAALSQDQVDEALFDGITGALDRFSRYASSEAARDQRAARDGFGGIGVTFDPAPDRFRIIKVLPGSPADLAGIRAGDTIVAVDGKPTAGRSQNDVIRLLRGPVVSTVGVSVTRPGIAQSRYYQLQRTLIVEPTVTLSREKDIAIFHISSFNQNTTQQLVEDLDTIKRESGTKLTGIVLDLRGDPGGLLDQAVSLSDVFIAKGPIVATVGRNPASRQFFEAAGDSLAPQIPIVVLVNGGSASASEIVAAALQDAGRAVVVGTASYGKGTVQTVLRLPNNGELTLTWAQLVAPAGYLLHEHGVVPTLCTSDLSDDDRSVQIALQRASGLSEVSPLATRPRATLDEAGWQQLRGSCPPRDGDRAIDLMVAERLLADPVLYRQAAHVIAAQPKLAARPSGATPAFADPGLTGVDGSLSSGSRNP
ncbi:MAG TPA: S41 family peptidase [Stellaceae bacterium]|nr:S41 family peptidase [Stellaceae bacterium]